VGHKDEGFAERLLHAQFIGIIDISAWSPFSYFIIRLAGLFN